MRRVFFVKADENGEPYVPALGGNLQTVANDTRMFAENRRILNKSIGKYYVELQAEILDLMGGSVPMTTSSFFC